MKVFEIDGDLAVPLPNELIEALGLKEGDELEVVAVREGVVELVRVQGPSRSDQWDRDRRID